MQDNIKVLNFDDFYKFLTSIGLLLASASYVYMYIILFSQENIKLTIGKAIFIVAPNIIGISILLWSLSKWYENQKIYDEKLKIELDINKSYADILKTQREKANPTGINVNVTPV